jgi:hypothetical protein
LKYTQLWSVARKAFSIILLCMQKRFAQHEQVSLIPFSCVVIFGEEIRFSLFCSLYCHRAPSIPAFSRHVIGCAWAGIHRRTRGIPPHKSGSVWRRSLSGRFCPRVPPQRADAVVHRPSVCTGGGMAAPDTLPDGFGHASPRDFSKDRTRSPAISRRPLLPPHLA